jgi:hypothetical protein
VAKPKKAIVVDTGADGTLMDVDNLRGATLNGVIQGEGVGGSIPIPLFRVDKIVFKVRDANNNVVNHECKPAQGVGLAIQANVELLGLDCLDGLEVVVGKSDGTRAPSIKAP